MGIFCKGKPEPAAPLAPAPFPIGIHDFYAQHPVEIALKVREKKASVSGDDFSVQDAVTGQNLFKVEGKVFSLGGKKLFKDSKGNPLFILRRKLLTVRSKYEGLDPSTEEVIFVVQSTSFWSLRGARLTATFKNRVGDDEEVTLHLKGSLFDRKAEIMTAGGVPVARIARSYLNAGEILMARQTYILTVAPGVDSALLLAICICLDEEVNDSHVAIGAGAGSSGG